jgi:hypothetical protein
MYTRRGLCDVYDFIRHVFCKFIDMWAGVVFEHVNELTEDMTNKVVSISQSTSRIYSYTPPVAPHPVYIVTLLPKHCKVKCHSPCLMSTL